MLLSVENLVQEKKKKRLMMLLYYQSYYGLSYLHPCTPVQHCYILTGYSSPYLC